MSTTDTSTDAQPGGGGADLDESYRPGLLERPVSRPIAPHAEGHRLRGRPALYTAYTQDMALLNTPAKRGWTAALLLAVLVGTFVLPADLVVLASTAFVFCIGAIGLNIVTGFAGQVSLGHAFFFGIGAYVAAVLSGDPDGRLLGYGVDLIFVWLPAAGIVAALAGALVAPLALRLKGLYLAIVTLGLVFLGEHIFREARPITGGPGVGREGARVWLGFGDRFDADGEILGVFVSRAQRVYLLTLLLLIVLGVVARNIARSDLGRAFAAIRDRDIAAEIIGVDLTRGKVLAFVISSFYAGVAGGLFVVVNEFFDPTSFNLLLSIRFIAMILIGGVATVSGAMMGAVFVAVLPRVSFELAEALPEGIGLEPAVIEGLMYGTLIVGFLILEPRGLFGLWFRIRNYWKAWPFSY